MITIEFTRNGQTGTKKVHTFALALSLAFLRRDGYTITNDGTAPTPPAPATAARTGRVGKGREVHNLVDGGLTQCGSAYRRGTNREVRVTGEAVTCQHCH
jgi:hypothetical protein